MSKETLPCSTLTDASIVIMAYTGRWSGTSIHTFENARAICYSWAVIGPIIKRKAGGAFLNVCINVCSKLWECLRV